MKANSLHRSKPVHSPFFLFRFVHRLFRGQLSTENGHYVVETLARACDGCLKGEFAALITGPVHKGVINEAGIPFTGIRSSSKSAHVARKW